MKFRWMVAAGCGMAMAGVSVLADSVSAADVGSHPASAKKQLVTCMTKRMSDSRTLSYNDATKLCKEQLAVQRATLAQSVLAKPLLP